MDPITLMLILGGVGAATGLGTSIFGASKSAKAAREQKAQLANYERTANADNEAWYNRNYYQDYLNSGESGRAIRQVREFLTDQNKAAAGQAAMTGATPEAVAAQKANNNRLMTTTISDQASAAQDRKNAVDAAYLSNKNTIKNSVLNGTMQQLQLDEAGGAQLSASGTQGLQNSLQMLGMGMTGGTVGVGTGAGTAGLGTGTGAVTGLSAYDLEKLNRSINSLNTNYAQRFGALKQ
jgi:hypothetical protein